MDDFFLSPWCHVIVGIVLCDRFSFFLQKTVHFMLFPTNFAYRRVTQTLPPVTDIFGHFLNVCCIFSGETAKDF